MKPEIPEITVNKIKEILLRWRAVSQVTSYRACALDGTQWVKEYKDDAYFQKELKKALEASIFDLVTQFTDEDEYDEDDCREFDISEFDLSLETLVNDPLGESVTNSVRLAAKELGYYIILVHSLGGGEGGGDTTERIFAIMPASVEYPDDDANGQLAALQHAYAIVKVSGWYGSYSGTEWNDEFELMTPYVKPSLFFNKEKDLK